MVLTDIAFIPAFYFLWSIDCLCCPFDCLLNVLWINFSIAGGSIYLLRTLLSLIISVSTSSIRHGIVQLSIAGSITSISKTI